MAPNRKKGFLHAVGSALGQIAGSVGEVVSSAGELLVDSDLRRKGAQYIVQEASRGINEAQKGLEASADALGRTIQQGAKARFGAGARQLQSVLRNIERQIQDFQRQQQQRDLQAELEHHSKLPVDIQIGDQVFEDMPQEMRSRFWYVLLERPDLAQQLMKQCSSRAASTQPLAAGASSSGSLSSNQQTGHQNQQTGHQEQGCTTHSAAHSSTRLTTQEAAAAGDAEASRTNPQHNSPRHADATRQQASPFAAASASPEPTGGVEAATAGLTAADQHGSRTTNGGSRQAISAAVAAASANSAQETPADSSSSVQQTSAASSTALDANSLQQQTQSSGAAAAAVDMGAAGAGVDAAANQSVPSNSAAAAAIAAEEAAASELPRAPSPWTSGHNVTSLDPPVTAGDSPATAGDVDAAFSALSSPLAPSPWQMAQSSGALATLSDPAVAATAESSSPDEPASRSGEDAAAAAGGAGSQAAGVPAPSISAADGEGWEMVSRDVPSAKAGVTADMEAMDTVRTLVESMSEDASLNGQRAAVFQAMLEVPWVAGEGIPDSPADGTEYAELLAAGCGSVEEVILRDVPRTFPEHPLFNTADGQQRLLRVLKAYAAADPEVGYCQGMAFAVGVLLMYLPEEPAFRLYKRIMSPEGPNLRRYYLPGLDHLKLELSCFELLLSSHQPQLHQHLLDAGLPALLYAAQWLMTTYSCPFPVHVAARVLDVLLQSDSDAMLPRLGLSVMEALSSQLLELDDFEELITYLKVKPLSWPLHTHRKVFSAALESAATDSELQAAAVAAREEFARSGRAASFSSKHLARQATLGGSTRHELQPGPMGPRTQAATEAAAAMACEAVDGSGAGMTSPESSSSAEGTSVQEGSVSTAAHSRHASTDSSQQQQQQRQLSGRPSSMPDAVLVGSASSGIVVDELDALEDLLTDLDLLLPGGASETDSDLESPVPVAAQQQEVPTQTRQQL